MPDISEELVSALIVELVRSGAIDESALLNADLSPEARHLLKALIVEASVPPEPKLKAVKA